MPADWERAWTLFEHAVERPPDDRDGFLDEACGDDAELRHAVSALLEVDERDDAWIDRPLVGRAEPAAASPERLGSYKVLRKIGEGGMGSVFLAVQDEGSFQRRVVVKVIRPGMERASVLHRLRTERRILAGLQHRYIARLYDGGSERGLPYFVMEYVDGVPIDRYCDRHELAVAERLALFRKVCSAVHYAHQNLVVHRDLKPSNILVTSDGAPRLLDFGIAKILNPELAATELEPTATGSRMMTPSYASPEQVRGEPITTGSDVYSLGVLLYLLLAGRLPFDFTGRSPAEVEKVLTGEEPPPPSAAAESLAAKGRRVVDPDALRGDLDAIVLKALRPSPLQRYGSVEQLADDVDRYLGGLPVAARRGTWRYRSGKLLRRHRAAAAAAAGVVLLLASFAWAMARQSARVERERDQAIAERDKKEQVLALVQEIIELAEPYRTPGVELSLRGAVERSAPIIETRLRDRPELRAELLHTTGSILARLADYEAARPQLEESLAIRRRLHGAPSREVGESLTALASVLKETAEHEAAEALAREAVAMTRQRVGSHHPELLPPLNELVSVLCYRGDYEAAEGWSREAMGLLEALGDRGPRQRLMAMELAGIIANELGAPGEAAPVLQRALALRRSLFGESHPSLLTGLNNLGLALRWLEDFEGAERAYAESLALIAATYGEDHPNHAIALGNLGGVRFARGDFSGAEEAYRRAYESWRAVAGDDHWRTFFLDLRLQSARVRLGHAADAEGRIRDGLQKWRPALGPDHWVLPFAESLLGEALMEQGDEAAAEPLLRDSFLRLIELGARERHQRQALDRFARLLERLGRADELPHHRARIGDGDGTG